MKRTVPFFPLSPNSHGASRNTFPLISFNSQMAFFFYTSILFKESLAWWDVHGLNSVSIQTKTDLTSHNFINFEWKYEMNLRRDSQLQKQWTQDESSTKTKQPTNNSSQNTNTTVKDKVVNFPVCAFLSLGCNHSSSLIQANCLISRYSNSHRDLKDEKNKIKLSMWCFGTRVQEN